MGGAHPPLCRFLLRPLRNKLSLPGLWRPSDFFVQGDDQFAAGCDVRFPELAKLGREFIVLQEAIRGPACGYDDGQLFVARLCQNDSPSAAEW